MRLSISAPCWAWRKLHNVGVMEVKTWGGWWGMATMGSSGLRNKSCVLTERPPTAEIQNSDDRATTLEAAALSEEVTRAQCTASAPRHAPVSAPYTAPRPHFNHFWLILLLINSAFYSEVRLWLLLNCCRWYLNKNSLETNCEFVLRRGYLKCA